MKDEISDDIKRGVQTDAGANSAVTERRVSSSSLIPHPSSLRWLVQISRFGLAALFLFAVGAKLYTITDFVQNLSSLVGSARAWPVAIAVIVAEAIAAALLIWPRTARVGGLWAAVLLTGFAGYALYYVYVEHGEPLECGCFGGIIASQLGVKTALRNLCLLIPAALVFFGLPRTRRTKAAALKTEEAQPLA
jgi:hypothetical protein